MLTYIETDKEKTTYYLVTISKALPESFYVFTEHLVVENLWFGPYIMGPN